VLKPWPWAPRWACGWSTATGHSRCWGLSSARTWGKQGKELRGGGGLYPYFQGSLHYQNLGGRIPSVHLRDGMVGTTHHNACVQPACIEIHIACSPPCLTSNWGLRHGTQVIFGALGENNPYLRCLAEQAAIVMLMFAHPTLYTPTAPSWGPTRSTSPRHPICHSVLSAHLSSIISSERLHAV
jgi:hypothetical protein